VSLNYSSVGAANYAGEASIQQRRASVTSGAPRPLGLGIMPVCCGLLINNKATVEPDSISVNGISYAQVRLVGWIHKNMVEQTSDFIMFKLEDETGVVEILLTVRSDQVAWMQQEIENTLAETKSVGNVRKKRLAITGTVGLNNENEIVVKPVSMRAVENAEGFFYHYSEIVNILTSEKENFDSEPLTNAKPANSDNNVNIPLPAIVNDINLPQGAVEYINATDDTTIQQQKEYLFKCVEYSSLNMPKTEDGNKQSDVKLVVATYTSHLNKTNLEAEQILRLCLEELELFLIGPDYDENLSFDTLQNSKMYFLI